MIIVEPLFEKATQVLLAENNKPIETLPLDPLYPGFREGIRIWTQRRNGPEFEAIGFEDRTELLRELAVPIQDDVCGLVLVWLFVEDHAHVAGLLGHPRAIGVGRHAGDVDTPCVNMDEEQDIVGNRSSQRPDLRREEVGRPKCLDVPLDEVVPTTVPSLRAGIEPVLDEDTGNRRSGHGCQTS